MCLKGQRKSVFARLDSLPVSREFEPHQKLLLFP